MGSITEVGQTMGSFERDVMAAMDGKADKVIEARLMEIEEFRRILWATPWESQDGIYRKLRELREELDVIRVVATSC